MGGVEAELDSGLEGGLAKVSKEVADLLFAFVDDLPGLGRVDRRCDLLTKRLKAVAHLRRQILC